MRRSLEFSDENDASEGPEFRNHVCKMRSSFLSEVFYWAQNLKKKPFEWVGQGGRECGEVPISQTKMMRVRVVILEMLYGAFVPFWKFLNGAQN